jgi:hypothetical protein
MTARTLLSWHRVFGDRCACYAECALGTFRTRTKGGRVILTLNDVKIGDHHGLALARQQADRLIEATAAHFARAPSQSPDGPPS